MAGAPNAYSDPYYQELAASTEQKLGLPVGLLSSIVMKGERSNADQVSSAGAKSVFQIVPATRDAGLKKYGIDAYLSPENAAEVAGKLLKDSLTRNKGSVADAVSEYHGGTNRDNWGPLTKAYTGRVLAGKARAKIDTLSQDFAKFMATNSAGSVAPTADDDAQPADDKLSQGFGAFLAQKKQSLPSTGPSDVNNPADGASTQNDGPQGTTIKGLMGAAVRGGGPIAAGAALGAAAGAPLAGVGAIPGAAAGAGAAALTTLVGDPLVGAVNKLFGTNYSTPSESISHLMDAAGIAKPTTSAERVMQAAAGSAGGAAGIAAGAKALASGVVTAGRPVLAGVLDTLAASPGTQTIAGAGAGASGQAAQEMGAGAGTQFAASLLGGIGAAGAAGGLQRINAARTATLAPEQQAIIDAGKAADVPVMTSDLIAPDSFMSKSLQSMGERIPVAGTGPVRAAQQSARAESVADITAQYGKPDYEAIVGSVKGRIGRIKKAAGRVINQTGQTLDSAGPVAPVKATQAIDDAISELTRPEVYKPGYQSYVDDLIQIKDTFQNSPKYTNLRETRTALREVMEAVDPAGRSQLPSRTKALFTKAYSAIKDDMDDFANANLPANSVVKLNKANIVYGETAGVLKNTRLKTVLDKGDVKPEIVKNIIFNGQPSEMKMLYESLGTSGKQNVRAALIDDAASKSVLADGSINPNRFGAELAKHDKRIDAFFKGDERDAIKGMTRLMQVTRRAQDSQLAPTNGSSAIPYSLAAGALVDLGATIAAAATTGGMARIYESVPVRNLLLKLQATAPQSRREGNIIRALAATIQSESKRNKPTETKDKEKL